MMTHTARILQSPPVAEYLAQLKRYEDLANQMPSGDINSPSHELRRAAADYQAKCQFPPGLVESCQRRLLGADPAYADCHVDAVLGLNVGKSKVRKASRQETIDAAVRKALRGLDAKEAALRKEINDYKAQHRGRLCGRWPAYSCQPEFT